MTFDLGILLGLIAVAVAVYFGLWGFRKDIGDKLTDIRDKVMAMGTTLDKAWDLLKIRLGGEFGTVERELTNLGKTRISAKPGQDETVYFVEVERPVLQDDFISKLAKGTDFEAKEMEFFGGQLTRISTPIPTRMTVKIPCTEARKCTDYMSMFLKWLDSVYYDALPKIKEYEEPIQV
jgi:hypothetical protein